MLLFLFLACAEPQPPAPPASVPPRTPDALELKRKALAEEVRAMVGELEAAGRYDCCIESPCKLCAMRAGGCRCGPAARKGEPVCDECAVMWIQGQGAEPVEAGTIRSFLEAERMARGQYGAICGGAPKTLGAPTEPPQAQ